MAGAAAPPQVYPGKSPYVMLPVEDCVAEVLRHVVGSLEAELVCLCSSAGRVLAADVAATSPVPSFPASIMDGFSVRSSDGPGRFPVDAMAGTTAGNASRVALAAGHVRYITTGAPVPEGADAVVKVEDTKEVWEQGQLYIDVPLGVSTPGANIRKVGSDTAQGEVVLRQGQKIGAGEIGLLAALGRAEVLVYRRPRVAFFSTGDELVDVMAAGTQDDGRGQIVDCNRPMLRALVEEAGAEAVDMGIVRDEGEELQKTLTAALAAADVVVTSGGVSRGSKDHMKPLLEQAGELHFGEMCMKPGKPTTFATVPSTNGRAQRRLVFALPGNPVSCFVTFKLLVVPALEQLRGRADAVGAYPRVDVQLLRDVEMDPVRPEYTRAVARWEGGRIVAASTGFQRSSRIASVAAANCFLETPKGSGPLRAGTVVKALLLPGGLNAGVDHFPSAPVAASAPAAAAAAASAGSAAGASLRTVGILALGPEGSAALDALTQPLAAKAAEGVNVQCRAVSAEADPVCSAVTEWSKPSERGPRPNLVLVVGNFESHALGVTGDSVAERLRAMLNSEAPNVTDLIHRVGMASSPLMMLAELVAGFRNGALVVTVPAASALACMEAIWPLLPGLMPP